MSRFIKQAGLPSMLKDGASVQEEPLLKNIQACKELAQMTRSSFGPFGLNKMVINHIGKLFVTHDAAVILRELEVQHPAANLLVMASRAMEEEVGDGSNLTIMLAGELLQKAEHLRKMGLKPAEIAQGYAHALEKAEEILLTKKIGEVTDLRDQDAVVKALRSCLASKQYGYEDFLGGLIAAACINTCPKNTKNFNVDNVRVLKVKGGGIQDTQHIRGFCIARSTEGTIKHAKSAKVAVYNCGIDAGSTETKGNVLIETAEELINFSKGEEETLDRCVKAVADTGVKVVVSNANFSQLAQHFCQKYGLMMVKVQSKFEMKRLCGAVGAKQLVRFEPPSKEDCGYCDSVDQIEMGDTQVIVFRQDTDDSRISTIILRGATDQALDDIERAIDDGVSVVKTMTRDARFVPGAGAAELLLADALTTFGEAQPGLEQYSIQKFGQALEVVPRTLAENAGLDATTMIAEMYAAHKAGNTAVGIDIVDSGTADCGILDLLATKREAIKMATDAAVTVLRVDQIIMSKPAGGPKAPAQEGIDDD